jgi:thiamine-phosphate pyrophosphorylase
MASALARAKLARAALALNAGLRLPSLILMTDEKRLPDPFPAARALPRGAAIILRHTHAQTRASLAQALRRIAHERGLLLLIAADPALASRCGADGLHRPETRAREARHWKTLHPSWLITVAAHSEAALGAAARSGADAALLAPAFQTLSHLERASLGAARLMLMAARAKLPVYALGGINAGNIVRLSGARLAGVAAIEGLVADQSA